MFDRRQNKPITFVSDSEQASQPWKETMFTRNSRDVNVSGSGPIKAVVSKEIDSTWNEFGCRTSGSYSIVNACFVPNDDCDSLVSDHSGVEIIEDETAVKKAD